MVVAMKIVTMKIKIVSYKAILNILNKLLKNYYTDETKYLSGDPKQYYITP